MANSYFQFKQFIVHQDRCAMKVTTDACLFGAWAVKEAGSQRPEAGAVLDIGTGTGLLSLMLAQKTDAHFDAIEIDKDAAGQAAENVAVSPWKERIHIIRGDIKELSATLPGKYDIIISNPPFYENELSSENSRKNIAHHSGGLLLHELLTAIQLLLDSEGVFYILLPYKRMNEASPLFQKHRLAITNMFLVRQSTQHDYFRVFIAGTHIIKSKEIPARNEIAVWNEKNQYTKEFTGLLKDYYLYL